MALTLGQLAERLGATLIGDADPVINACAPIATAGPAEVAFVANARYVRYLDSTQAGAVIVDAATAGPDSLSRLVVPNPYFAFRQAMVALHGFRVHPPVLEDRGDGVSSRAIVHPEATLGDGSRVYGGAVIEAGASLGRNAIIYPGVFLGQHTSVGDDCILYPNVTVYDRCTLGHRVIIQAGTVIGNDGYGFAMDQGVHHKIPHPGTVILEDDVELGACCAVQRAAMTETRIGQGTKVGDMVAVGHATTIGRHCLIVSTVGIAGSAEIGDHVVLAGQVGVAGHIRVGHRVQAAGKTAIVADVPDDAKIGGMPAQPLVEAKRNALVARDLFGLAKRVRNLERALKKLQPGSEEEES